MKRFIKHLSVLLLFVASTSFAGNDFIQTETKPQKEKQEEKSKEKKEKKKKSKTRTYKPPKEDK